MPSSSPFPCPLERTAASALLLLSADCRPPTPTPTPSSPPSPCPLFCSDSGKKRRESFLLSDSKSCSSSLASDCSSEAFQANRRRFYAAVARCREIKLKVVRKSRSKMNWSSDCRKMTSANLEVSAAASAGCMSESAEASCLSSESSGVSSKRSRSAASQRKKKGGFARVEPRKRPVGSAHMHRRAEAILKLLSGGGSSEVRIRQLLGDSPDTSKALRMLLKLEEVRRSGAGGRADPYVYTIA